SGCGALGPGPRS
nr:hypothetical protein [Tanacetum cinerariifolium]